MITVIHLVIKKGMLLPSVDDIVAAIGLLLYFTGKTYDRPRE